MTKRNYEKIEQNNNSDSTESDDDIEESKDSGTESDDNKISIMGKFTPKEKCYYKMINDFFDLKALSANWRIRAFVLGYLNNA